MSFEETSLNDNILDALYDMHFEEMTPIQEKCIPEILDERDLIGIAQTGTGKTAAYLLPILSMLDDGGYPKDAVNCIVMAPTRELAQQIDQAMQGFGYYLDGISSVAIYGGNDGSRFDVETKGLKMGADVIIATPGRLLSHIRMGHVDLSRLSFFVLDEADRMLDMGFSDDILSIAKLLPKEHQTIMFSASSVRCSRLANWNVSSSSRARRTRSRKSPVSCSACTSTVPLCTLTSHRLSATTSCTASRPDRSASS